MPKEVANGEALRKLEGHAALEWTTRGTPDGDTISYDGVSVQEIGDGKVNRFRAYFDPRRPTEQVLG